MKALLSPRPRLYTASHIYEPSLGFPRLASQVAPPWVTRASPKERVKEQEVSGSGTQRGGSFLNKCQTYNRRHSCVLEAAQHIQLGGHRRDTAQAKCKSLSFRFGAGVSKAEKAERSEPETGFKGTEWKVKCYFKAGESGFLRRRERRRLWAIGNITAAYFFLSLSFLRGWDKENVSAATFFLLKVFISSSRSRRFSSTFLFSSWCIRFSCSNLSWSWKRGAAEFCCSETTNDKRATLTEVFLSLSNLIVLFCVLMLSELEQHVYKNQPTTFILKRLRLTTLFWRNNGDK